MPTYTFKNKDTGEVWDEICTWEERCAFLEDNPEFTTIITKAPSLVSSRFTSERVKNDDGWQENLSRIAEAHPNSALADRYGSKDIKTVKTRDAVERWRKQTGRK